MSGATGTDAAAPSVDTSFSGSYREARERFLAAAREAGLSVESHAHPEQGLQGEDLAMDVVRDGPADTDRLLILSSACHGAEGFCGSGVQVDALRHDAFRAAAREAGVAVLYIHALNPWGFSHCARATNENVDLNRNFFDFSKPLPEKPGYREIAQLLIPETWPPPPTNDAAIAAFIAERGIAAYQQAVSGGQYEFPDGLFFGGHAPTWSNRTLRGVLRAHGSGARRIGWIDLHTGLGPSGLGERIYAGPDDAPTVARARRWWDGGGRTPVTSIYDGSSTSAFLTGLMWNALPEECPRATYAGIAMEYGTKPVVEVLHALRGAHWLRLHPEADPALATSIRQAVKGTLYVDTPEWKMRILAQAREAAMQALAGLRADD